MSRTTILKAMKRLAITLIMLSMIAIYASAASQTLTGVVSDTMCGRKHSMMPGKPDAECVRACVKEGAKYALVVGDKVYTLQGNNKQFDQFAGQKVKVSGDVNGSTLAVSSMVAD